MNHKKDHRQGNRWPFVVNAVQNIFKGVKAITLIKLFAFSERKNVWFLNHIFIIARNAL